MNGILFLLIILFLWLGRMKKAIDSGPSFSFWQQLRLALQKRDYTLEGLQAGHEVEAEILQAFHEAIRQGLLRSSTIDDLETVFGASLKLRLRSLRTLTLFAWHMGLALGIALCLRLFLQGEFWLHANDGPSLILTGIFFLLNLFLLSRRWPKLWSTDPDFSRNYVMANLDLGRKGPWQKDLTEIAEAAWREGGDPGPARRLILKTWADREEAKGEAALLFLEEMLGPFELFFSAVLIAILDFFPLLERVSGLNMSN